MNDLEHTFPLPEFEAHKLDEVKESITGHRPTRSAAAFAQTTPWVLVILGAAGGLLLGLWLNSRE